MGASYAAFTIRGRRTSGKPRSCHEIGPRHVALHHQASPSARTPVSQFIVIVALVFSILIAIFAVQNTTAVDVQFLTGRVQAVAVSVLVLVAAAIGALVMLLLGTAREVSLRWHHRATSQQLKQAQARVAQLEAAQAAAAPAPATTATASTETPPPAAKS
jgi:uncharacterized integral membrane protein